MNLSGEDRLALYELYSQGVKQAFVDELFEKEAIATRAATWLGKKLIRGAGKVSKGGRVSKAIGRASKAIGGQNLQKAVGYGAAGAAALGTGAFAAGRISKRSSLWDYVDDGEEN